MVRGLIFDCDGVLFDSLQANVAFYSAILQQLGLPPIDHNDRERSYLCHTVTTPELFEAILGPERLEEALQISRSIDYSKFIPLMTPEPGILEALPGFRDASRLRLQPTAAAACATLPVTSGWRSISRSSSPARMSSAANPIRTYC